MSEKYTINIPLKGENNEDREIDERFSDIETFSRQSYSADKDRSKKKAKKSKKTKKHNKRRYVKEEYDQDAGYKSKPKRKAKGGVGLLNIILLIVIIGIMFGGFSYFFCPLTDITVEGNHYSNAEDIKKAAYTDKYCANAMYMFIKGRVLGANDVEFVQKITYELTGLGRVNLVVKEKPMMGYLSNDDVTFIYIDYDGYITEISNRCLEDKLRIYGLECEKPKVGEQLNIGESEINYLLSLTKILIKYSIIPNVILYNPDKTVTLYYETLTVNVGSNSYLDDKLSRIQYIAPNLVGKVGVLHLENFSPDNTDIVFEDLTQQAQ